MAAAVLVAVAGWLFITAVSGEGPPEGLPLIAALVSGFIGLFMGLKTFSLMMLVMNMAFLSTAEVHWVLRWFRWPASQTVATAETTPPTPQLKQTVGTGAATGSKKN